MQTHQHSPKLLVWAIAAIPFVLATFPGHLAAQSPPPVPEPKADAVATQAASAASPFKWSEGLTVGVQLDEGRYQTRGVVITGDAWRKFSHGIVRFDIGESYGSIQANGQRIVSLDKQNLQLTLMRDLSPAVYFVQLDSINRDAVLLLDHRLASLNGIGIRVRKDKFALDFGPGFALVNQEKHTPEVDGFSFDLGAFYSIVYSIDPKWQFSHWATYRNNVAFASDRVVDSSIALTGMITKNVGLKIAAVYDYEGVISPATRLMGGTRNYITTTLGVTIRH